MGTTLKSQNVMDDRLSELHIQNFLVSKGLKRLITMKQIAFLFSVIFLSTNIVEQPRGKKFLVDELFGAHKLVT